MPCPNIMKILSIGNSFSRNAHTFLNEIAASAGCDLTLLNAYIGGCTFERHMIHADAFDKNPNDPEGTPYPFTKGCNLSLRECLKLKKWDIVTIQQASPSSFRPETYHPHADRLIATIRKYAKHTEIVVHETWAYRDDHEFWGRHDFGTDIMYKQLRKTYQDFCAENNFRMIPAGDAFQKARLSKKWGKPVPPNLKKNTQAIRSLHDEDKFHASDSGCYLLGCVWLETLFGKDVRNVTFKPDSLSDEDAAVLRDIAHRTVAGMTQ